MKMKEVSKEVSIFGCLGWIAGMTFAGWLLIIDPITETQMPPKPDFKVEFTRLEQWAYPKLELEEVDQNTFKAEYVNTRYYEFQDGTLGYKVKYHLSAIKADAPLAWAEEMERDGDGKMAMYKPKCFNAKVTLNDPDWKIANAKGWDWTLWKDNGEIQCVGSCSFDRVWVTFWGSHSAGLHANCVTIETRPEDGYFSTGEPMDAWPVHEIEIYFYVIPRDITED